MKASKSLCVWALCAALLGMAPAVSAAVPDLESTEVVTLVQEKLNAAGFDCGTPDGIAGANTRAAIQNYRASNGLPEGEEIDAELFNALTLSEEEKAFVQAARDACEKNLGEGDETGEITLYDRDLSITIVPDYTASELLPVQETAEAVTKALAAEASFEPLWDTITIGFGVLGEVVSKKEDYSFQAGVKEALDEYETFIDEYCAFMEALELGDASALSSYFSMVQEYDGYTEKMAAMQEGMMTPEDRQYYDEVMARVSERLAEVE